MSNAIVDVIEKQLEAYNNKDIEGWLRAYSINAVQYSTSGEILASGHDEMKANISVRFQEPNLHAELVNRIVCDDIVIDHELITRNFLEGKGTVEMLCIYHIKDGLIEKGEFKMFNKKLLE